MHTYCTIVAILERSKRCAASTADTIAPSRAERSHSSSVTKNFRARLKNADGPFDTLTAITCLGCSGGEVSSSPPCAEDSVPVVTASIVVGAVGVNGLFLSSKDKEEIPIEVAPVPGAGAPAVVLGRTGDVGGSPTSNFSPPLPLSDIMSEGYNGTIGKLYYPPSTIN